MNPNRDMTGLAEPVQLGASGDVWVILPAGIVKRFAHKHYKDHDHYEFTGMGGAQPFVWIDVNSRKSSPDPWANALKLDASFAKAYGPRYQKRTLMRHSNGVEWEFDLTKNGHTFRKNDFLRRLEDGRSGAVLLQADAATFEQFRSSLDQLHNTFVEGIEPDPGG